MKKSRWILLTAALLFQTALFGQIPWEQADTTLRRTPFQIKVVSKSGKPFRGRTAIALASNKKTQSLNKQGIAVLQVCPNDTIFLTFGNQIGTIPVNGYDSLEVCINGNKLLRKGDFNDREVNLGYGTVRASASTASTGSLDVEELTSRGAYSSLADLMQGRFAGVSVIRQGGGYTLQIRGASSLYSSNEPLIIVNGSQYQNFDIVNSMLNPMDIKKIDILKDGSIYGVRGANGVVIITTK